MAAREALYPATIHTTAAARWRRLLGRDWALGWALVAPVVVIVLTLLAYPFANAIYLSFTDSHIGKGGQFVGLANYVDILTDRNNLALKALGITGLITGGAIFGKLLIGLAMASVLNQEIPARNLFRGLMFLPWAVPAVVSAYAWRFLFDTSGPINGAIAQFQLADDYIYFFNDAKLALPSLIAVVIWSGTPFWTMNILAGMQAISSEMYEAAEIDGAGTFQRFLYVTLPSLQHVLFVTGLLSTIWTSANLTQIFVLTGGGPNYATSTIPFLSYLTAIPGTQIGMGSAQSMLLVPFYCVLVYFLTRRMLRQD
jgi:multiple sugar transport system permease protein